MEPVRVAVAGKYFWLGRHKWYVKGFSYGPFAANSCGDHLPEPSQVAADFRQLHVLGANSIRVYHVPPTWLLDAAEDHGLRVFVDVPWDKHRCFFEDWAAQREARHRITDTARTIGQHPAVFAISVVNELPNDITRFYGRRRVEGFVEDLLDTAKQAAPDCLATFVNYPTTEFLQPAGQDFCCFNVYLHDPQTLGTYLDRLQHLAGDKPLILGEYGLDTIREGEQEQAHRLVAHVDQVFRHGLAGSFVFSYTDDWYTGGQQIDDWAFGVTHRDRTEKPAARELERIWRQPQAFTGERPPVSVVVCSYNGGVTLRECLDSLARVDYPDFEVLLIDDGSTDDTPAIAREFPQVRYFAQVNKGLSVARNVGAELATGTIVAYTDSDCVVDPDWLTYLVQAMQDQQVDAIGGPNLPPYSDCWFARCVAASPGGPSHVMLNDRYAEHVPGCNMAFYRDQLLALGGFDPQFRQAGDDVDMCWRWIDAGWQIGFAPGAMVWHHRRATVRAYLKQQAGYGRSEAMVHFKHPQRFDALGKSNWRGVIYGDGAVGLSVLPPLIYHGRFGSAPFQTIYHQNTYSAWAWVSTLEWHAVALFVLALSTLYPWLVAICVSMWLASLGLAWRSALKAALPPRHPWWCRPMICWLYLIQPIVRGWTRHTHLLRGKRLPACFAPGGKDSAKRISALERDLYWDDQHGRGREGLLAKIVESAAECGWRGDFDNHWADWDLRLVGDPWHEIEIHTVTEELGSSRRFTRARCRVSATFFQRVAAVACTTWSIAAACHQHAVALALAALASSLLLATFVRSRRRCLRAATWLVHVAGVRAELGAPPLKGQCFDAIHADPADRSRDSESREEFPPAPAHSNAEAVL